MAVLVYGWWVCSFLSKSSIGTLLSEAFCCARLHSHPLMCFLCCGMYWIPSLRFCSHSRKPLMVIHHKDNCPYSQGTVATFDLFKKKKIHVYILEKNMCLFVFTGNTMGEFLNAHKAGNEVWENYIHKSLSWFREISSVEVSTGIS